MGLPGSKDYTVISIYGSEALSIFIWQFTFDAGVGPVVGYTFSTEHCIFL